MATHNVAKTQKNPAHTLTDTRAIEAQLEALAAEQAASAERILALRAQLARGTADVTEQARTAAKAALPVAKPEPAQPLVTLAARLEALLRSAARSHDDLVLETAAPAGRVAAALRALKASRQIYNLGSEDRPRWVWVVGDQTSTPDLRVAVEAILRERPTTFAELLAATGARRGRVSGVIVALQREGARIERHGDEHRERWFLAPAPAAKRPAARRVQTSSR
jgi:myo-inositol catabolism protein IolC